MTMAGQDLNEPVTRGMLDEAVTAIFKGVDKLFSKLKGEMDIRFGQVQTRLDKVDDQLQGVKTELSHVKDEINGLKTDLSDTPFWRELEELKDKVEDHIQLPH